MYSTQTDDNNNANELLLEDNGIGSINDAGPSPISKRKHRRCPGCCSWKCTCLGTLTIVLTTLIIVMLVGRFSVAPKFAQSVLDNASMTVVSGTISDPTDSTITLQTTIRISNAGFLDGELAAATFAVFNEDIRLGTMQMPSMTTTANQDTVHSVTSVLKVENSTHFKISCGGLLQNKDQIWHLSASEIEISVATGVMGTQKFSVGIEKDLVLKGANLYNFFATNFNVESATDSAVTSKADLTLISDSVFTFSLPLSLLEVYAGDVYLGYAPVTNMTIAPGFNTIPDQPMVIEKTAENKAILNDFFGTYMARKDQTVIMKGPKPGMKNKINYGVTVIDGIFNEEVTATGFDGDSMAFGGSLTSQSQTGWTVTVDGQKKHIRGAYSDFKNPLDVPVKITQMSAFVTMPRTLAYSVKLIKYVGTTYHCNEGPIFAHLSLGPGIVQDNPTQTWVDVEANDATTYFAIAGPEPGSDDDKESCAGGKFPFSCCFATLSEAYACSLNPRAQKNPNSGQLHSNFMPLALDSNLTLLIDNQFEINVTYQQDFLPLYFGWQIYGGYASTLGLSCTSFNFTPN